MSNGASSYRTWWADAAEWLSRRGLSAPALFLLELHRPFALIAGQSLHFFQPLLSFFVSDEWLRDAARALDDGDGLRALIERLEAGE